MHSNNKLFKLDKFKDDMEKYNNLTQKLTKKKNIFGKQNNFVSQQYIYYILLFNNN